MTRFCRLSFVYRSFFTTFQTARQIGLPTGADANGFQRLIAVVTGKSTAHLTL